MNRYQHDILPVTLLLDKDQQDIVSKYIKRSSPGFPVTLRGADMDIVLWSAGIGAIRGYIRDTLK